MRLDLLLAVNDARNNPANVPAVLDGWSVIVTSVDRLLVDLTDLVTCWRAVKAAGVASTGAAADEVLAAFGDLLGRADSSATRVPTPRSHGRSGHRPSRMGQRIISSYLLT